MFLLITKACVSAAEKDFPTPQKYRPKCYQTRILFQFDLLEEIHDEVKWVLLFL